MIFAKDEPELKELYASLLSSVMDPSETSVHPSFVSIIQQLTPDEAKILRHITQLDEEWPSLSEYNATEGEALVSVSLQFKEWCEQAGVSHLDGSGAYMDNLIRLRIFNQVMAGDTIYDPENAGDWKDPLYHWSEYMRLELTSFGRHFLDACIEKTEPNRVAGGFSPPAPTTRSKRVRTARFT